MRVLVAGCQGMLAQELVPCLKGSGFEVVSRGRRQGQKKLDICQIDSIREVFKEVQPDFLINVAAYTEVDRAESEPDAAFSVNRDGAAWLAEACHLARIPLIHISTDYVFDGITTYPYKEDDPVQPLGVYGQSKWEGEKAIRNCHYQHLIVRSAWLYSQYGTNFVNTMLRLAGEQEDLKIVDDQQGCPTWTRDLALALTAICERIKLSRSNVPWGTYHYCGSGSTTWHGFAQAIIEEAKVFQNLLVQEVIPIPTEAFPTLVRRPKYSVLDCSKIQDRFGIIPPTWQKGLHNCIREIYRCSTSLPAVF